MKRNYLLSKHPQIFQPAQTCDACIILTQLNIYQALWGEWQSGLSPAPGLGPPVADPLPFLNVIRRQLRVFRN